MMLLFVNRQIFLILVVLWVVSFSSSTSASVGGSLRELPLLQSLLDQDEASIDYATTKLTIDRLIDSSIDVEVEEEIINEMVETIRASYPPGASAWVRFQALKKYLYEAGSWNDGRKFQYDFDDPLGTKISNKLLPNYIRNRKGNCITMPLLFVILGDKIGLDVTVSTAPLHLFVRFMDEDGQVYNLEATSGANVTRTAWYREQLNISEQAVNSGIYMQSLSRKETVAAMITVLAEYYYQRGEYEKAALVSEMTLKYYPKYVNAMLRLGSAYYRLMQKKYISLYLRPGDIPVAQRKDFSLLAQGNLYWFNKAESLGWRKPSPQEEARYLDQIQGGALSH